METNRIEWTRRSTRREVRQIAKCKRCKKAHSRLVVRLTLTEERSDKIGFVSRRIWLEGNPSGVWACGCSGGVAYNNVCGTRNDDIKCDARCTEATGHKCECSCGGKNHGSGHGSL